MIYDWLQDLQHNYNDLQWFTMIFKVVDDQLQSITRWFKMIYNQLQGDLQWFTTNYKVVYNDLQPITR